MNKKYKFTTLYCEECGSTNVEMRMWVNPNTNEIGDDCGDYDCSWCNDCQYHVQLRTLPELWKRFNRISVNKDGEIEDCFLNFPPGTSKYNVLHWFDERCPNNLHDDLMSNK